MASSLNAIAHTDDPCERRLEEPSTNVVLPWLHFRASILKKYAGYEMKRPDATGHIDLAMADIDPSPFLRSATWRSPKTYFTFVDSGFRRLEAISQQINALALRHLKENPTANLRVRFSPSLQARISTLSNFRWQVHDAVLRVYSTKKNYLDTKDLLLLKFGNVWSGNSDVFAVLSGSTFSAYESLHPLEIDRRLALTIQISYFGDENYLKPTARGIMRPLGMEKYAEAFDLLPFEYRLPEKQRVPLRQKLNEKFDLRHSCEIGRYAKFLPLPLSTQQKFLLHAFTTIRDRGVKTIFAAGDSNTIRLFRRYGFKNFGQLPTGRQEDPEFLTYLEVNSPEFERIIHRLTMDSDGTETIGGFSES